MRKIFIVAIWFLAFLCAFPLCVSALDISAKGAVLLEAQSGDVAFEKNMNQRMPMASTTKIMTALIVLENAKTDDIITITEEMTGIEGSSIYLRQGEKLTVSELLYALMLESANDAAIALAIHTGGSIDNFVKMMNDKAKELGLSDTSFNNPHGLDSDNHYTTPYELGIITLEALKNEELSSIISCTKKVISAPDGASRVLINHNKMLRTYEGAIGVKTGFTKRCGRCLVSSATRNGVTLVAVTLNAPNDWDDHKKLLDYGFSQYESILLARPKDYQISFDVTNGSEKRFLAENADEIRVTVKNDSINISATLEANRLIFAPVKKGQAIGKIVFYNNKEKIAELPLYAKEDINNITYNKSIFERLFKQWKK